ncbi:D-aminoacyl-tRNA deacylase [Alkalihalobacillus sp. AL-G]|uniref:D-aminoacyl-tRNA deacylase n=1 Tax=Alkalihalobacillus sp. AL-G TaxID=2926399 RepID=UPI00272A4C28|nr:D-aminoacyl-tRNA deacylase [Alkalihalobacillus sp. AL-G]WLD92207.1 D-aminoacyl-tRNA deacylase [Alkalihalobacillus sp. AL-G]
MRVVVQRASYGKVTVAGEVIGQIECGLVLLVGVTHEDTEEDVEFLVNKIPNLRIFEDDQGKMNRSLLDIEGQILSISQFTLFGDCRKGRRPNFMQAAKPEHAEALYHRFNQSLIEKGVHVETGEFGAMMDVQFNNQGPVTLILDTSE